MLDHKQSEKAEQQAPTTSGLAQPLLAAILLAIDLARSPEDLAAWWAQHQPALKRLAPPEIEVAIAAKDRAKARLAAPPPRGQPPPAVAWPARNPWPADTGRLL